MNWLIGLQVLLLVLLVGNFIVFQYPVVKQKPINIDAPIHIPASPKPAPVKETEVSIVDVQDNFGNDITVMVDFASPSHLTVRTEGGNLIIEEEGADATAAKTRTIQLLEDKEVSIHSARLSPLDGRTRLALGVSQKEE